MKHNIVVCNHPLLTHHLSILRDKATDSDKFRHTIKRVTNLIGYEATKNLRLTDQNIETPLAAIATQVLDDTPIIISPILRAGLSMVDVMLEFIPKAHVYHLGLYRDESTFKPVIYYNKLGLIHENSHVFILDPMMATGGSITAAISLYKDHGAKEANLTILSILASPFGLSSITDKFPELTIYVGAIDESLNQQAFIVPGLGDAGDRMFCT